MNISVNNQVGVDNKFVRLALWKLYRLEKKFPHLQGTQLNILRVSPKCNEFRITLKLKTMTESFVLRQRSSCIAKIFSLLNKDAHRYLYSQKKMMRLYNAAV